MLRACLQLFTSILLAVMTDVLRLYFWYGSVAAEAKAKKGFLPVTDNKDGYTFLYPFGWQVGYIIVFFMLRHILLLHVSLPSQPVLFLQWVPSIVLSHSSFNLFRHIGWIRKLLLKDKTRSSKMLLNLLKASVWIWSPLPNKIFVILGPLRRFANYYAL